MKRPHSPEKLNGAPALHGAQARPTRSRRVRKHRRRFVGFLAEGFGELSPREQILIGATADVMVRFNEANAYLDQHGIALNGEPVPMLKTYVALLNALRRNLETLGLRPDNARRVQTLAEYLGERSAGAATAVTGDDSDSTAAPTRAETNAPQSGSIEATTNPATAGETEDER